MDQNLLCFLSVLQVCCFPLDSLSLVAQMCLSTCYFAMASPVVKRGKLLFHISIAIFLLLRLVSYFDLLILLPTTIPISDSALLISTYFWFDIYICYIQHYLSFFTCFITGNYSNLSKFLIHIPSLQLLSCLVVKIHWVLYTYSHVWHHHLPWKMWDKHSPRRGLYVLLSLRENYSLFNTVHFVISALFQWELPVLSVLMHRTTLKLR